MGKNLTNSRKNLANSIKKLRRKLRKELILMFNLNFNKNIFVIEYLSISF
jgi:hypothetical protein